MSTRLNKFIAHAAGLSRREADVAIEAGRVKVNNARAILGMQITPEDIVLIDNRPLRHEALDYVYLLLHKPAGYVCSRRQQGDTPTIYSLLPSQYQELKPVGRLDKDSSGLILLTNDGDFAHRMTHPSFVKTKQYLVELDNPLEPLHQQMISDYGVQLDDGTSRFLVAQVDQIARTYSVTMSEGRNRQIRRTFAALGYTVTKLHRISFGPYSLTDEKPGEFHLVDKQ